MSVAQFESFELNAAVSQMRNRAGVPEVVAIMPLPLAAVRPIFAKGVKTSILVKLNQYARGVYLIKT